MKKDIDIQFSFIRHFCCSRSSNYMSLTYVNSRFLITPQISISITLYLCIVHAESTNQYIAADTRKN